jgi:hypothetical protein
MVRRVLYAKEGILKKKLYQIIAIVIILSMLLCSSGNVYASYTFGRDRQGMTWITWDNDKKGRSYFDATIPMGYNSNWSCEPGSNFDFSCGKGWDYGDINRKVHYEGSFDSGNNSHLALYSWMKLPETENYQLAECIIVESYGDVMPVNSDTYIIPLGTMTSDGATYKMYRTTKINKACIGTVRDQSYYQYWSVRTPKLQPGEISGDITFRNHVNAWKKAGLTVGDPSSYKQMIMPRSHDSTGSISIKFYDIIFEPYIQKIRINLSFDNDADVLYINSESKLTPAAHDYPTGNKAIFEMHVLDYQFVDWNNWKRFVPVVAIKSMRTGQYLTVVNSVNRIKANSYFISTPQKFYFQNNYGYCDFKSLYNNLSIDSSGRASNNSYSNFHVDYLD